MKILIVEDVPSKLVDVQQVVQQICPINSEFTIATNLSDAEDLIMADGWNLVVLDISMDISDTGSIGFTGGHATLAGLDVLERMSLMKLGQPTVLVTGFDSFQDVDRFDNAIMNLTDIDSLAAKWLGSSYLGCVRYGPPEWSKQLTKKLQVWRKNCEF